MRPVKLTMIIGIMTFLLGTTYSVYADGCQRPEHKNKKCKCVKPAKKYSGQEKSNNGHGNNKDGVDRSNPGKSKAGEDSNPREDDENKSGKR